MSNIGVKSSYDARTRLRQVIRHYKMRFGKPYRVNSDYTKVGNSFYHQRDVPTLRALLSELSRLDAEHASVEPTPNTPTCAHDGKADVGKPRFDLLDADCPHAVLGVVQVLTWAVETKGYAPGSWVAVPDGIRRYSAALSRHQNAKARGERYDPESGLLHDFHIAANAVFLAELEARIDRDKETSSQPTA